MVRTSRAKRVELIALFGNGCQRCGYSRCQRALQFHHKDAATKPPKSGRASLRDVATHPALFEMLCANCHFEEHSEQDKQKPILFANCLFCGEPFRTEAARATYGRDRYCSRRCQHLHRTASAADMDKVAKRLWKRVRKGPNCWEWTGYTMRGETPIISITTPDGKHHPRPAARIAYEIVHGPLPSSVKIRRVCNNPLCVRPAKGHVTPVH